MSRDKLARTLALLGVVQFDRLSRLSSEEYSQLEFPSVKFLRSKTQIQEQLVSVPHFISFTINAEDS